MHALNWNASPWTIVLDGRIKYESCKFSVEIYIINRPLDVAWEPSIICSLYVDPEGRSVPTVECLKNLYTNWYKLEEKPSDG